jgi:hypothetical protein
MVEELGGDGNAPGFGALAEGRSLSLSSFFKLVAIFPSLKPVICEFFYRRDSVYDVYSLG